MKLKDIWKSNHFKDINNVRIKERDLVWFNEKPYEVKKIKEKYLSYLAIKMADTGKIIPLSNFSKYNEIEKIEKNKSYLFKDIPISCYDNDVYNALLRWIKKTKVKTIAVKFDSLQKQIIVYSNRPGILIGKAGKEINEVEKIIKKSSAYKDYELILEEITCAININDLEVTDEEFMKKNMDYWMSRGF